MLGRPCGAVVVDDPVAQQQFAELVPGAHQIAAAILRGAHQVTGSFLIGRGNGDRGDLVQPQQPGSPDSGERRWRPHPSQHALEPDYSSSSSPQRRRNATLIGVPVSNSFPRHRFRVQAKPSQ